jgi:CheY-like chemotaxis protein
MMRSEAHAALPAGVGPECLVITTSNNVVRALVPMLEAMKVRTEVCPNARDGMCKIARHKFDAVIVDCTSGITGLETIRGVRSLDSGKHAIVVAIVSGYPGMRDSFRAGASFVLDEPLPTDMTSKILRVAYGLMLGERRRYYRHAVDLQVSVTLPSGDQMNARSTNLSERGIGLLSPFPLKAGQTLRLRFSLPGDPEPIETKAEVAWAHGESGKAGLRFLTMPAAALFQMKTFFLKLLSNPVDQAA